MQNVAYNTVLYRFINSSHLDGSIVNLVCAVDIPEGAVVAVNSSGQAILCTASLEPIGVARYSRKAGTTLAVDNDCIIENKGTSLALTPGAAVFAGAAGIVAGTGTKKVGIALTANKFKVSV
ncbi:capsid cement protein [Nostoc sp. UHCC 0252]|uniref:capsid cement protein n=1 Tax=Nostoc sp. UHCC 0252 TaxID=3110241 RepID=UPI002B204837|nr:capsid cement protein [Nostoc sp. UHCC 0252]MEA5605480.1 capsid cement protein [Nostoc sp. UHCC 0252]